MKALLGIQSGGAPLAVSLKTADARKLDDPTLLLAVYRDHEAQRSNAEHDQSRASRHHLETQIKTANQALSRLLDAYQVRPVSLSTL